MTKIKNDSGDDLILTTTRLRLTGDCHDDVIKLVDLRPSVDRIDAFVLPYGVCALGRVGVLRRKGQFRVDVVGRRIGCCSFDDVTWSKIVKAARAARKTSKARKSSKK